jgi:hypothetical protein
LSLLFEASSIPWCSQTFRNVSRNVAGSWAPVVIVALRLRTLFHLIGGLAFLYGDNSIPGARIRVNWRTRVRVAHWPGATKNNGAVTKIPPARVQVGEYP